MLKTFDYEKTPVVDIVNEILIDATKRGASDIHFDPQESYTKVRIRIDGELIDYSDVPLTITKNLITRIKIISGMNITESRLPQDGAIKATLENIDMDMRVSTLPTNKGEKIVIRILDYSLSSAGLENLGFSENNLKRVLKMISDPNGIILVTGATGSGKSTTVYSILQKLNKEDINIISVEDPIEMDIEGVNQIQTNSEIGLDFATVLRSILRQDPNIIMIGEIRDTETAKIAVRAAITGHLVLSTIHTNDSLSTIERLLDMEVERYLLSSALTGIISQKLARKLCPDCRELRPTNDYEKQIFRRVLGKEINEIYSANGCDKCHNGYSGRMAIHEVLIINQEIKDAISGNVRKEELRQLVYNGEIVTLIQDGIDKVLKGETTLEELLKLIELDDEEGYKSTGLENALEINEFNQQASNENNEESIKEINKEIENVFEEKNNETKEGIKNETKFEKQSENNKETIEKVEIPSDIDIPSDESWINKFKFNKDKPVQNETVAKENIKSEQKSEIKQEIEQTKTSPKTNEEKLAEIRKSLLNSKNKIFK